MCIYLDNEIDLNACSVQLDVLLVSDMLKESLKCEWYVDCACIRVICEMNV